MPFIFSICPYIMLVLSKEKLPVFDQDMRSLCTVNASSLWRLKGTKVCLLYFKHACLNSGVLATMNVNLLKCCHLANVQSFISALWNTNANKVPLNISFYFKAYVAMPPSSNPTFHQSCVLYPPPAPSCFAQTWVPPLKITDSCDYI